MRHGWTELVDVVRLGRGIEALTADRYDEAWVQLRQLIDFPAASSTWVRLLAVGFLAETGLRLRERARCRGRAGGRRATDASRFGAASAPDAASGVTAYAHAVTELCDAGDTAFDRALAACPCRPGLRPRPGSTSHEGCGSAAAVGSRSPVCRCTRPSWSSSSWRHGLGRSGQERAAGDREHADCRRDAGDAEVADRPGAADRADGRRAG